jgi:hypothetical protein
MADGITAAVIFYLIDGSLFAVSILEKCTWPENFLLMKNKLKLLACLIILSSTGAQQKTYCNPLNLDCITPHSNFSETGRHRATG